MADEPAALKPELAGYPDTDSLVAGYRASSEEGKRQRERADKLETLVTQLMENAANPRQTVPDRRAHKPEDRLQEFGVPVDALDEYVGRRINEGVQKALEPILNGVGARGKLVARRPDYVQFESDVAQFIATDPELSQSYPALFEKNAEAALEYAFLKFGESRRRAASVPDGDRGNVVDASIPSSRAGEGRRAPDVSQQLQAAYERFQKSGTRQDAEAYARLRLHSVISDDHLNA